MRARPHADAGEADRDRDGDAYRDADGVADADAVGQLRRWLAGRRDLHVVPEDCQPAACTPSGTTSTFAIAVSSSRQPTNVAVELAYRSSVISIPAAGTTSPSASASGCAAAAEHLHSQRSRLRVDIARSQDCPPPPAPLHRALRRLQRGRSRPYGRRPLVRGDPLRRRHR
jgi:hypothetical protein